mmetsp:Transcript_9558/g.20668  ORF Transcript_9558/g.20668 Transcript_9558/m.20668 type:complete len:397 (+) Transcript_9558:194-1384(+)
MIRNNNSIQNDDGDRAVVDDSDDPKDNIASSDRVTIKTENTTSEDRIVESIHQHVMESICRDVASNLHEMIKTGAADVIPSSWKLFAGNKMPSRRELYPELYNGSSSDGRIDNDSSEMVDTGKGGDKTDENRDSKPKTRKRMTDGEIESVLDKFAVDLPSSSSSSISPKTSRKRQPLRDMAQEEEERRLLSKIKKRKESNYKDDSEDNEDDVTNGDNDDEDEDDEEFKIDDAEGEDDDDEDMGGTRKKKRTLSSSSATPSTGSTIEQPVSSLLSTASATTANLTTTKATPTATTTSTTNNNNNNNSNHPTVDIWGKTPAKEPKNRLCRCQLCGRLISTSRFASHLDKCMGLSTSRGGASSISASMAGAKNMLMSSSSSMSGVMLTKKTKRGGTLLK